MKKNYLISCFLTLCLIFISCSLDSDLDKKTTTISAQEKGKKEISRMSSNQENTSFSKKEAPIYTLDIPSPTTRSKLPANILAHMQNGEFSLYTSYAGHQIEEIIWNAAASYYQFGSTVHYPIFRIKNNQVIYRNTQKNPWNPIAITGITENLKYLLNLDSTHNSKKIIGIKQHPANKNLLIFYVQDHELTFYVKEHANGYIWLRGVDSYGKENNLSFTYYAPINHYSQEGVAKEDFKKELPHFKTASRDMTQVFHLVFYAKAGVSFKMTFYQDDCE
ncbi:MAG: hypothetical protein ACRCTJ_06320 [Brevinema sp.]